MLELWALEGTLDTHINRAGLAAYFSGWSLVLFSPTTCLLVVFGRAGDQNDFGGGGGKHTF